MYGIGNNSYESVGLKNNRPSVEELSAVCHFTSNTGLEKLALSKGYIVKESRYDKTANTYIEKIVKVTKAGLDHYLKLKKEKENYERKTIHSKRPNKRK